MCAASVAVLSVAVPVGWASQLTRQREVHLLLASGDFPRGLRAPARELLDDLLHEQLGSGGTGRQADGALARKPFTLEVRRAIDEVAGDACAVGELPQAV